MKISELKKEALVKLSGKWGKAAGIYIVVTLISFGMALIPNVSTSAAVVFLLNLFISLVSFAFSYGLLASMIKLSRTEKVDLMDFVTIGLKNIWKIIKIYLVMILKLWLPILLYIVAAVLIGVSAYMLAASEANALIYMLASCILLIVSCILFIVKSLLYSLQFYLLYDNPNAKAGEILNKSAELMKGNRMKYLLTELSFLGWVILVVFASVLAAPILPILSPILMLVGTLILSPYMSFTLINFYEDVAGISDVQEVVAEKENQEN